MPPGSPEKTLNILSPLEYRVLSAIAHRITPAAAAFPHLDLARKIDVILAGVSKRMGQEFKLLLVAFEYGTLLFGHSVKRFTRMSDAEQDRYLTTWAHSRVPFKRMGFQALKRSVLGAYYGSSEAWPRIGYSGPWLNRGYPPDYPGKEIVTLHGH